METLDLFYEEWGDSSAKPLIILHGFFASSRNWRKIAERLSKTNHVYVLDLRNHGASPHHIKMDYQSMAVDVLAFMDKHGIQYANVLGHSMGGKCAMWMALTHPERIGKLIVVDIAPKSYKHSFDKLILALKALPLDKLKNRKQAEEFLLKEIPEIEYRQFLLQNLELKEKGYSWRINLDIFCDAAPNIVAFPEINNLAVYNGIVFFIVGSTSGYVAIDDLLTLFPNARLEVIEKAGHWVHVQQPEVFLEKVEKFLQKG